MLTQEIIEKITNYVLSYDFGTASCFEIYNTYVGANNINVDEEDDVLWILEYVNDLQVMKNTPSIMYLLNR